MGTLNLRLSFGHFSLRAKRKNGEHEYAKPGGVDDVFIVMVSLVPPDSLFQSTFLRDPLLSSLSKRSNFCSDVAALLAND